MPLDFMLNLASLGHAKNMDKKGYQLQQSQLAMQDRQFYQQMNQSIQARVKDARAAGVHPLYALGASAGATPTAGPVNQAGNSVSGALQGLGASLARAQIRAQDASAKKDESEAALADATTATIAQRLASQGRDMETTTYPSGNSVMSYPSPANNFGQGPVFGPAELYNPAVPTSQRPGVASGRIPTRIEVTDPAGNTYTLPSPDLGLDEVGQIEYVLGIPGRMWNNIRGVQSKNREVRKLNDELTRLRNVRQNPQRAAEYEALKRRIKAKVKYLYAKLRRYTK